jgi:predicted metalloprotease with PDZ domain
MKRLVSLLTTLLVVASAIPALAGEGHKCTADTQTCLDNMAAKFQTKGWLGVELDENEGGDGYVITKVVGDSPADEAGFRNGDLLVAMNGLRFAEENHEKLQAAWKEAKPGAEVAYTISRRGREREKTVTLAKFPHDLMAQYVGEHMLEHAQVQAADDD